MMNHEQVWAQSQLRREAIEKTYTCECTDTTVVRRKNSIGAITTWVQCNRCGRAIKSVPKANYNINELAWFDEEKRASFQSARQEAYAKERERCQRTLDEVNDRERQARESERRSWWDKYNQYLQSIAWRALRDEVLKRDKHTCQACLRQRATQVHHLSYDLYNITGQSMAFECVAICNQCHEKIHPHMAEVQRAVDGFSFVVPFNIDD